MEAGSLKGSKQLSGADVTRTMLSAIQSQGDITTTDAVLSCHRWLSRSLVGCSACGLFRLAPDQIELADELRQQRYMPPLQNRWIGEDIAAKSCLETIETAPVTSPGSSDCVVVLASY